MVLLKSNMHKLKKGNIAPDFSLRNIDSQYISRSDFIGKAMVIIFMCNHCPYVKPKMQEIADLQRDYADKGIAVIGINANDSTDYPEDDFEHMLQIAEQFGYQYYLVDETQEIAQSYGATCTPDTFVFDNEHKLIYHGRINDAMSPVDKPGKHDIREVLDLMLAGNPIENWFIPSMGCSIKWKR